MLNAIRPTSAEAVKPRLYVPESSDRAEAPQAASKASQAYYRDAFESAGAGEAEPVENGGVDAPQSQDDSLTQTIGKLLDAVKNLLSTVSSLLSGRGDEAASGADASDGAAGEVTPRPPEAGQPMKVDHVEATHDYSVKQTTKDGRQAWRFEVRDGDVQQWDQHNVGPGGKPNQRAEISYAPSADSAKRNSPYNATPESGIKTYSMGVNFEKGWPNDQRWATLMQFHPQESPGVWGFSGINVHGDRIDIPKPFAPDGAGQDIWSAKIEPGKWYDIQLQVKWSTGSDGFVKVMVNGKEAGSYQGKTIAPGEAYYLKQGYYRDGAIGRTGVVYQTPITVS